MAEITLHTDKANTATSVSNTFIDHYMTSANGEYVKIYLYLLRCMSAPGCSFSISKAADKFEHTEKDIQRALRYWEKMNLLRLEYDPEKRLSGIYFLDSGSKDDSVIMEAHGRADASAGNQQPVPGPKQIPSGVPAPADTKEATAKGHSYTAAELAAFQEKDTVRELLFVTEHYMKRPLTATDINTILFWYDGLKFSVDLIEYLIEYCIGKGHTSTRYMDKVAMGWKDEGVSTVAQAKSVSSSFSQMHFSVMRALGISGRSLVSSETAYIDKWSKQLGFTQDIIMEACRRTIANTHQPSFEYTDGILSNWSKKQVRHLSDVAKLDSQYQKSRPAAASQPKTAPSNRFNNFTQRTYDYEKLEQQLLRKPDDQEVTCP